MMSSRAENGSYSMRKTNFWRSNHTCVICQDLCPSSQDKENHEKEAKHKRKLLIYDFFAKEVPKSPSFVGSSVLLKRYTACGEQAIGLECLHELHFSFNSVPWWACSICYESGVLMEQADMHLFSRAHIETYLDEFHSSKFSKARFVGDPLKVFNELKRLCDKVFEEQGRENLAPECLVVDSSITLSGAMARLGIKSTSLQPSYNLHMDPRKNETTRRTLQCLICHQLVACNDELLKRVWDKHELSPDHRRAVAVVTFLEQFQFERAVLAEVVAPRKPFSWRVEKDRSYGPVCGLKFLVAFNKGNFCRLCCTAVESVENHFSSEYHIMKFLTVLYPVEMFQALQYGRMSRMRKAVELISKATFRLENEKARKVHIDWFPQCLATVLKPESHVFPTIMPAISPLGRDSNCLFCPVCLLCLNVAKDVKDGGETLWNAHCEELSHFEFAVRRACLFFDEKFFVPLSSKVPRAPRMLRGHWSEIKEGKEISYVQTQGDVGLEFIVDDLENEEVVCTLCARWFARGMDTIINNHIRSYAHFYHYLHSNNRSLLSMILMQKKARASRELMLEWLQQSSYDERDEMRSYSPEIANRMLHWGSISIRKVDATSYGSELRPAFECLMTMVDKVAVDNVESSVISVKEALDRAGVRILELKQKIEKVGRMLCRCTQCGLVFSSTVDTVVNSVWDNHLASQQHFARSQAFTTNKLDMLGFTDNISSYTVKPFKQQDPSNKVAWQWNAVKKAHEFVLTVIGLEDLVERRSSETVGVQSPDFFCRLCALVIPRQSSSLESHVRSLQHVLFFVHKYHPNIIMEMDSLPEGGMEMRKILAQLLKRHEPKSLHCIPIYDPVGEQKRKAVIAMQKAKDAEYQLQLAESRQAEQQRLRNEEKHRKQCEVETHQEERKLAERGRKEKEINGRIKRPEEEVSVLKLHKEAARKAKDERQTMEENEREIMESERLRRQDELRMLLVQEKQRLKALQVKEATQRHLWEEKDILERKLHELERCHEDTIMLHKLPAFEQDSRSSFHMEGHPTYPIKKPHELHQQSCLLGSDAPDMRIGPVPPPTSPFSISPSGMWKSQESTSQTVFKPFVAIASTSEEQARVKEARLAISSKVKQSELERQDTTFRPSLRDRKVDPYISNGNIIQTRDQLVDFIWRQGAERIPINELPLKFNQKAAEIEGALGIDSLYEVVCVDCSDLDTFYCSMCGVWTTPNDMFQHLETTGHKLAYLFRNYKMYHQTIVSESNFLARSAMLNQFAIKIWKMERPPGKVSNRLRSLLDRATIERIWPEYTALLDHSWKDEGRTVGRVEVPPPISKKVLNLIDEESIKLKEKEKYKDKKQFEESISLKERDKHYSIPKKRGKEKDEREKEESLCSRKHLPTFERPKQGNNRRQTSPDRKRHRSRSLERRRSHSHKRLRDVSCNHSKHSRHRSRSCSRNHRRNRSRSRVTRCCSRRTSRRSRSRSKIANGIENSGLSWEATAAAFLRKLGDPKGAALVSQPSSNTNVVDEKLKQWINTTESQRTAHTSSMVKEFLEHQERLKKLQELRTITESDEKAQMRKLLGVLITMQQDAERCGSLDKSMIDKLYKEVGLKKSVDSSDQLLAQLCSQVCHNNETSNKTAIELQSFGIIKPENLPSQASSSILGGGFNSQSHHLTPESARPSLTQTLLDEVKRSLGKLESARQLSPIVRSPPFVITNRDDMFQGAETIPYIYPCSNSIGASESTNQTGLASNARTALPSSVITQNEKAPRGREQLFKNTKQARKQAAEEIVGGVDDDDDDWDCLAEVISRPSPFKVDFGKSSKMRSGYKRDDENDLKTPIAPGQKMPLARTILPNGETLPSAISMQHEISKQEESSMEQNRSGNFKRVQDIPFSWPQRLPQPFMSSLVEQNTLLQPQPPQQYYSGREIMDQQQYCYSQDVVDLQQTLSTYGIPQMPQQQYYG